MDTSVFKSFRFKNFVKEFYQHLMDHDVFGIAAELSYYCLFSIFPLLIFLVALAAYLPIQGTVNETLVRLSMIMPKEAMDIIQSTLDDLVNKQHPRLLSIGVLISLWSASRAVSAFITGMNMAYGIKESRSYIKVQALSIGLTLASAFLVLLVLALIVLGGKLGYMLADHLHVGRYYVAIGALVRWPVGALVVMLTVSANYYFLPDVKPKIINLLPGAIIGTLAWILCTWGFTKYVHDFGNYNATYGSIGGVIVLMTWLYLSGLIFLIGGEINAILDPAKKPGPPPDQARALATA